jgi:hypothetical protein
MPKPIFNDDTIYDDIANQEKQIRQSYTSPLDFNRLATLDSHYMNFKNR